MVTAVPPSSISSHLHSLENRDPRQETQADFLEHAGSQSYVLPAWTVNIKVHCSGKPKLSANLNTATTLNCASWSDLHKSHFA